MILPSNELKNFSYFTKEIIKGGYYDNYDMITLYYKWLIFKYKKQFRFRRKLVGNLLHATDDYLELVK